MNKQKVLLVSVLSFAFTLVAGTAFATMTFNTNTITSDGDLILTPSGNIGIGTSSPDNLLSLYQSSDHGPRLSLDNGSELFVITNDPGSDGLLSFDYGEADRLEFDTAKQWFPFGNVGINTNDPQGKLEVDGSIYSNADETNTIFNGGGPGWQDHANFVGTGGLWALRTGTNGAMNLDTNNSFSPITALTVLQNGKVGIGTANPDTSLAFASAYGNKINLYNGAPQGFGLAPNTVYGFLNNASDKFAIYDTPTLTNELFTINGNGNVGIGKAGANAKLDINSNSFILETAKTPSSASDTCTTGMIAWDSGYVYVCVGTNTWKRSALATW